MGDNQKLYVILGPTASGKTSRAVGLAKYLDGEIISADSRQIYCGMDIGTGKDLQEYGDVRYHLIDICDAGYKYNLYEYLRDYQVAETDIKARGKAVVLCGGTGLYIESVLKGIRLPEVPENQRLREELKDKSLAELTEILASYKTLHNITDVDTAKRAIRAIEIQQYYQDNPEKAVTVSPNPITNAVVVGIDIPREKRRERITARLHKRLEDGMVDEKFENSILEREKKGATDNVFGGAIPHAVVSTVKKTCLALWVNSEPIKWTKYKAKVIVFLAIAEQDSKKMKLVLEKGFSFIKSKEIVDVLSSCTTREELLTQIYGGINFD